MRKVVYFIAAMFFVFGLTSCDDQGRKCHDPKKCPDKQYQKERHERRW